MSEENDVEVSGRVREKSVAKLYEWVREWMSKLMSE